MTDDRQTDEQTYVRVSVRARCDEQAGGSGQGKGNRRLQGPRETGLMLTYALE